MAMTLGSSLILYLMLGAGVAVALFVREGAGGAAGAFRLATACVFWPLYVPILLARGVPPESTATSRATEARRQAGDEMSAAIVRVEDELDRALQTLDGWAEGTLSLEAARIAELKHAWHAQADRIRELSLLLETASAGNATADDSLPAEDAGSSGAERLRHSEQARRENIERLRQLRRRMHDDLMGTLAWVRELVTMIHLARYTGAPASRAEELVVQIAAAVEGLSEVSDWRQEPMECSPVTP
jgi:hypothetical protein